MTVRNAATTFRRAIVWVRAAAVAAALGWLTIGAAQESVTQSAKAEDLRVIFAPIIGEFRSPTHLFDDGKTEHHFRISYQWFDPDRSIVRFTVATVIPSQARSIVNSAGYYWFDPVRRQIAVFGAFANGTIGTGTIGSFDHSTRTHEVWASSAGADGTVTHVRDSFEVIDDDTWKNRTRVRSKDGDWQVVHEGRYSRVRE